MHPALFMRRFERLGDLAGNAEGLVQRKRALPDAIGQRRAFHQLHHQVIWPDIIELANVWMIERSNHFRFPFKSLAEPRG